MVLATQFVIRALALHELVVGARFYYAAALDDQNSSGGLNSGQPVSNHKADPIRKQSLQALLNQLLCCSING